MNDRSPQTSSLSANPDDSTGYRRGGKGGGSGRRRPASGSSAGGGRMLGINLILAVLVAGLVVFMTACPCGPVPGAWLLGEQASAPVEDWSFVNNRNSVPLCQVEITTWRAHSINLNCMADDGTLYVSTREGQVWTYRDGRWQLFADGLHEPLGLYVDPKTRQVFCMQRPELTELIDENGDGRADRYRTVCADFGQTVKNCAVAQHDHE